MQRGSGQSIHRCERARDVTYSYIFQFAITGVFVIHSNKLNESTELKQYFKSTSQQISSKVDIFHRT
jgi:hypothetical protein